MCGVQVQAIRVLDSREGRGCRVRGVLVLMSWEAGIQNELKVFLDSTTASMSQPSRLWWLMLQLWTTAFMLEKFRSSQCLRPCCGSSIA